MTDPPPTPSETALIEAASQPVDDFAPGLVRNTRASFRSPDAAGLRPFFHWPLEVESDVRRGSEGAAVVSFRPNEETETSVWMSRAGIAYAEGEAAGFAASVLAPWMKNAVAAIDEIAEVEPLVVEPFGDSLLWSSRGRGTSEARQPWRADVGWQRGRFLCCVVAFGPENASEVAVVCARQMDRRLTEL